MAASSKTPHAVGFWLTGMMLNPRPWRRPRSARRCHRPVWLECLAVPSPGETSWSVLDAVHGLSDAISGAWWGQILGTKDRPTLRVRIVAAGYCGFDHMQRTRRNPFKRPKSLIPMDELRASDPDLAQTYLLAQILGAVLGDAIPLWISRPYGHPLPYGVFPH